ncbi:MAG: uroporphyrinogen-III C-methyltransferase [Oscillatoriales cyanobacterium SM2_1_8]|nr:uroporphyrinogen-III C-methyltransferase [Oscillatoriales cyanobacterium SM2_1_8]
MANGTVYLVGAGPGDPDLLTLRGKARLEVAEAVVYDALIHPEVLRWVPPHAERICVGKRRGHHSWVQADITQLLIQKARQYRHVVRLKGGDPFLFGRGGEEMGDLQAAGVAVEVVPGITAGLAVPAAFGLPITHRGHSSSVVLVTGHEAAGQYPPRICWEAIARSADTIVIYMGLHHLPQIVPQLLAGGRPPSTPITLLSAGLGPPRQHWSTLGTVLAELAATPFEPPAIVTIGAVVGWAIAHRAISPATDTD